MSTGAGPRSIRGQSSLGDVDWRTTGQRCRLGCRCNAVEETTQLSAAVTVKGSWNVKRAGLKLATIIKLTVGAHGEFGGEPHGGTEFAVIGTGYEVVVNPRWVEPILRDDGNG